MKTLIVKEIRLMLPAFAVTLLLIPLGPILSNAGDLGTMGASYLFWFGFVLLAVSSFGREFGLKTLPFMLTQPVERGRIWWTKIAVLAVFMELAFGAWCLFGGPSVGAPRSWPPGAWAFFGLMIAAFATGGLLMALVLRQVAAAFWLTLLLPMASGIAIKLLDGADWMVFTVLGTYAVAAFLLAWRQFLRLQDTGWTGGVIALGVGDSNPSDSARRNHRPWAALFWKELQLQQFTFVAMGCLLALHLGTIVPRNVGARTYSRATLTTLEIIAGLWLFAPFIAGAQSVAEERKLGTMGGISCLPRSSRMQWLMKWTSVMVIAWLSATLCWVPEHLWGGNHISYAWCLAFFLGVAQLGFYGSSLANGVVQAMGAATLTLFFLAAGLALPASGPAATYFQQFPIGGLLLLIGVPLATAALIWRSYRNFQDVSESGKLWRHNALSLVAVVAASWGLSTATYYRPWEWLTPLEPPHGLALIPTGKPTVLKSSFETLAILLPDGRLWKDRFFRDLRWIFLGFHEDETLRSAGRGQFAPGSNWLVVAEAHARTLAIRADGTLWVAERPLGTDVPMTQYGRETNWLSVASSFSGMVLLKRDGTLWNWAHPDIGGRRTRLGLRDIKPYQIGRDTDWARVLDGWPLCYAWKKDGSAWGLSITHSDTPDQVAAEVQLERSPILDNTHWRTISYWALLRDDGTLWFWDRWHPALPGKSQGEPIPVQIGVETNWADAAVGAGAVIARKTDGSLWKWEWPGPHGRYIDGRSIFSQMRETFSQPPVRCGTHSDWVALSHFEGKTVSLAADGSLWSWPEKDPVVIGYAGARNVFLNASRKPARIENIFDAGK